MLSTMTASPIMTASQMPAIRTPEAIGTAYGQLALRLVRA